MSAYYKSIVPLVAGIIVGVILFAVGEHDKGVTILLAITGASGISYAVPNRDPVTGRRHR